MLTEQSSLGRDVTRRGFCAQLGVAVVGLLVLRPRRVLAAAADAAKWLQQRAKGAPKAGRISLISPDLSENGAIVPLTIAVDSPMTEKDHVRAVHVAAEENPNPGLITIQFSPLVPKAEVQLRIRLAKTQRIVAVVEMSDGTLWSTSREIKVTVGGCG